MVSRAVIHHNCVSNLKRWSSSFHICRLSCFTEKTKKSNSIRCTRHSIYSAAQRCEFLLQMKLAFLSSKFRSKASHQESSWKGFLLYPVCYKETFLTISFLTISSIISVRKSIERKRPAFKFNLSMFQVENLACLMNNSHALPLKRQTKKMLLLGTGLVAIHQCFVFQHFFHCWHSI